MRHLCSKGLHTVIPSLVPVSPQNMPADPHLSLLDIKLHPIELVVEVKSQMKCRAVKRQM